MAYTIYNQYLESEVMTADPVKLVCMLYRGAIEATAAARRHLRAGEIRERSRQITRAFEILQELSQSLDPAQEISIRLSDLYAYMQSRLLEANVKQIEEPLAEVENLLSTLLEGWRGAVPAAAPVQDPASYQPVSCAY
jgi:flagellar protein FliS